MELNTTRFGLLPIFLTNWFIVLHWCSLLETNAQQDNSGYQNENILNHGVKVMLGVTANNDNGDDSNNEIRKSN
jgi:hypothetical protein